jgi:membrane-bound lytic murein transglycosylase D
MPLDYQALDLKLETEQYVPKLIAVANIVRDPAAYGLALAPIPNEPHFTVVDAGEQTDLGIVAELSNTSVEELFALNPGYSRWATAPGGPHRLLVRVGLEDSLSTALARLPDEKRMQWRRYEVRRGDTLAQIARHYGTTVAAIQSTNRIRGHIIRAGDDLLIPVTSRTAPAARTVASRSTIPAPARATGAGGSTKPVVHRVRRGDTLWGIARRYNVYIQQLASWNGIGTSEILRLGQALHVWPN